MDNITFPTSKNVYIEVNGEKLAVVESYKAISNCENKCIEAIGEGKPVAVIPGKVKYIIELSKIYVYQDLIGDSINFHNINNFNLIIVKPNKRVVYSGCEWVSINESTQIGKTITEAAIISATNRMEINS